MCKVGELDKERGARRRSICRPRRLETLCLCILSIFPGSFGKDDSIDHLLERALFLSPYHLTSLMPPAELH